MFISNSKYPVAEPKHIQEEMDKLFHWILTGRDQLHPVVFAAQLHKKFVFIQRIPISFNTSKQLTTIPKT